MAVRFTEYTINDKQDLLNMMSAFNNIAGYHFDRTTAEKNLVEFTCEKSLGRLFLIKYQKENIGYMVLAFGFSFEHKGRDAFIDEFYIKDNFRNKGIGKRAMSFIESECLKLGVNAIHLEVESHNANATRIYLNQGFKSNNRKLLTKKIKRTTKEV